MPWPQTFSLPAGAVRVASSRYCANQIFVLGKHLAMQCHVEMTEELIHAWCQDWEKELVDRASPSVQTPQQIQAGIEARVTALHGVADRLYDHWTSGLIGFIPNQSISE